KRAQRRDEAETQAELARFHDALTVERAGLAAWLDDLRSDDTAEYLDVLAGLAGRDPAIVRAVAKDIAGLLETLDSAGKSTPAQLEIARRKLVAQADKVLDIEADLYHRIEDHPALAGIECREQFRRHAPKDFKFSDLTPPREFLRQKEEEKKTEEPLSSIFGDLARRLAQQAEAAEPDLGAVNELLRWFSPDVCPNISQRAGLGDTKATEDELLERRLQSIEAILAVRSGLSDSDRKRMKTRFASQIMASLAAYRGLQRELIALESLIASEQLGLCAAAEVRDDDEAMQELDRLSEGLRAALLVEIIDTLIARVPTTQLDLSGLGLDRGDRLDLHVSLLPAAQGQTSVRQNTYSFEIQPSGWRAPAPIRITDTLSFAKGKGGDFEPRPGASAIWNFYGDGPRAGSLWRTIAPGFGVTATFLDFSEEEGADATSEDDDESIEVGLGLSLTLFDNLLAFTWGRNLMAEQDGSRDYFAIGFSVLETVDKFRKSTN
ncbi:MAG TPA: hypothetical protein VMM35_10295, partial [Longimicrobiales bacterium]|nr:hypothetical protein [Longimicrobiales bacterium]